MQDLRAGRAAEMPQYDFSTHKRVASTRKVRCARIEPCQQGTQRPPIRTRPVTAQHAYHPPPTPLGAPHWPPQLQPADVIIVEGILVRPRRLF